MVYLKDPCCVTDDFSINATIKRLKEDFYNVSIDLFDVSDPELAKQDIIDLDYVGKGEKFPSG